MCFLVLCQTSQSNTTTISRILNHGSAVICFVSTSFYGVLAQRALSWKNGYAVLACFALWMSKSSLNYIMLNGDGFLLPLTETWSHFCEWCSDFYCNSINCIAHLFKMSNVVLESLAYPVSWNKTINFIPLSLIGSTRVSTEYYALLNNTVLALAVSAKTTFCVIPFLWFFLCLKWWKYYAIFVYFSNYSRILESLLGKQSSEGFALPSKSHSAQLVLSCLWVNNWIRMLLEDKNLLKQFLTTWYGSRRQLDPKLYRSAVSLQ